MTSLRRFPTGILLGLGLIALSFLLYGRNFLAPPIWDDHYFVQNQSFLRDPWNLLLVLDPRHLFQVLPVSNSARPVWLASVLLDRALLGPSFAALRASSALWHGFGACLLALLAWELTASAPAAILAGVLFTAHPLHAEAVNIVTFRADAVAFVFLVLSLLLHLRARQVERGLPWRLASLASFALALLAKESATALPFLLPLVEWAAPRGRGGRGFSRPRVYAAFAVLLLAYAYFRVPRSGYVNCDGADLFSQWRMSHPGFFAPVSQAAASSHASWAPARELHDPPPWSRDILDPAARVRTMIQLHGDSLRRLFWPHPLQGEYSVRAVRSWGDPAFLASLAAWAVLFGSVLWLRRRRPLLAASLTWIPVSMVPVSGVIWMANLTADRYLYTASAGVCLAISAIAIDPSFGGSGRRARRARLSLGFGIAAVWAVLGAGRLQVFSSDRAFFGETASLDPEAARARLNLAIAQRGIGLFAEAERNFQATLSLWPRSRRAAREYEDFLQSQGRAEEARLLRARVSGDEDP